jgi:tRNA (uracil-5-)-methyltransferase TRM9
MDSETAEKLLALNRAFYASFARPFADSRPVRDPALTCILPYIPQRARVLDVGCGNGRLAFLLDRERPGVSYLGVDAVPELIEIARARVAGLAAISAEFRVADVARPGWVGTLCPRFDCAVALAVIHHIPGFEHRLRVLRDVAAVLEPGGCLLLSTWQFLVNARMRRKIVDWAEMGVAEEALEPGDYLLDWKRGGRGLRYCHLVDEAEVTALAAAGGFRVRETFRAGGREGNLSLVAVLDRG